MIELLEERLLLTAGEIEWIQQFGGTGPAQDSAQAVDGDGNVYVVGNTSGTLSGETSAGGADVFVRKYDSSGNELWTEQFGTAGSDIGNGISVDSSGVYVVGFTTGTFTGETSAGNHDVFVRKLNASDGGTQWTEQFGTSSNDSGNGISVDSSGVYVVGHTDGTFSGETNRGGTDAFVRTLNASDGGALWTVQFGTGYFDAGNGISVDSSGGVYVVGRTDGTFSGETSAGGADVFVLKYDSSGNELWSEQFGTAGFDLGTGIAVDSSGIYVVGHTDAFLGETIAGSYDAFLRKYDSSGNELWTAQFGTAGFDIDTGISVDSSGVYVVGRTDGTFSGETSAGSFDVFVRKYDSSGNELWSEQFGTAGSDAGTGISVDSSGVYVVGHTSGTFSGETSAGLSDVFVRKLSVSDGSPQWTDQFGAAAPTPDSAQAVDGDGNIYVVGWTSGTLSGETSAGGQDVFVRKYDSDGNELWTEQFGTAGSDTGNGISVDSSGVYVVGHTSGTFSGETSAGSIDVFVRKLNASDGGTQWTEQFGTSNFDICRGISADSSGVYVVGQISGTFSGETSAGGTDAFVRKYDSSGNELWTEQFGTAGADVGTGISVDSSGIYVVGRTEGTFLGETSAGGQDVFVRKLSASDGGAVWTKQFGTGYFDRGNGISVDSSGVYLVGRTDGTFSGETSAGGADVFVRKLSASDGGAVWTKQFGTAYSDLGNGISVDSSGVYVVGRTDGTFSGETSAGYTDVFVRKLNASDGGTKWTEQFGTSSSDIGNGISVDSSGVYVVGQTSGTFSGETSAGSSIRDVFVAKLTKSTPPTADAGGLYTVGEGGGLTLDASSTTDPDQAASTLTYAWDLDDDGIFGETGWVAVRGDETGIRPIFSAAGLDGPTSVTVSLRVTDDGGLTSTDTATINVEDRRISGVYVVTSTLDTVDSSDDATTFTLREAIRAANANSGPDTIVFEMPGTGVHTISLWSALPTITGAVIIDGTSQSGYSDKPLVRVDGAGAGSADGLFLSSHTGSAIRGLMVTRFSLFGIRIEHGGSHVVQGNYLGTDGTFDLGNFGGIYENSSSNNVIGGTAPADRNVISGNNHAGVRFVGGSGNVVQGNYIGTNATGTAAIANGMGVIIDQHQNGVVGGAAAAAGNLISGNAGRGVWINHSTATGNTVAGNIIGLDSTGTRALGNAGEGVYLAAGASSNVIGTDGDGTSDLSERNVISGNSGAGVFIADAGTSSNAITGNYIGTDPTGTTAIGNAFGIRIDSAGGNTVGGAAAGEGNLISGNSSVGVFINGTDATGNAVLGNRIGTDAAGTTALGNAQGVHIASAAGNTVGGSAAGEGNLVSGNWGVGIVIAESAATGNRVLGNRIGTDAAGTTALGNGQGVHIGGAAGNTIGGAGAGEGNLISGNTYGVWIGKPGATGNAVLGNRIGTTADGSAALGNSYGVFIDSAGNTVGGAEAGEGNLISGNSEYGVWIAGSGATGNVLLGNEIGTAADGIAALGNGTGVYIDSAGNALGGAATGQGNLISGNLKYGVHVTGSGSTGNRIRGNSIHANGGPGIDLGGNGVTANDAGDKDAGPNNLQDYPVIQQALSGSATLVAGTLHSTAGITFTLDFYASTVRDPSVYGEGERYLGAAQVTTDADGNASFKVTLSGATVGGEFLTATATDPAGSTSEFSTAVIVNTPPVADAGGPYTIHEGDSLALNAAASFDADGDGLTFTWDVNGDSVFGDATGPTPILTWADLAAIGIIDSPATFAVTVRVEDGRSGVATASATLTVKNTAPTVALSGATDVGESSAYVLMLGAVADPGQDTVTEYIVNWGDGTPDTMISAADLALAYGQVNHTYSDGAAGGTARTILVALTDEDGTHAGAGTTQVTVQNVAPSAGITGPSSGVRGQTLTFTVRATDPSKVDQAGDFTYAIDWNGDAVVDQTVNGPSSLDVDHVFDANGTHTVTVTAADKDGGTSAAATHSVKISGAAQSGDSINVGGTGGNDTITIRKGSVIVTFLDNLGDVLEQYTFADISGSIVVHGYAGDDDIRIDSAITNPVELYGGNGNDVLVGGSGNDLLDGGAGDDQLHGGTGDDTFDGGTGSNILDPGPGNDSLGLGYDLMIIAPGSLSGDSDAVLGQTVHFAASGTLPSGSQLSWTFGDALTAGSVHAVGHAYAEAGAYTAQLSVLDSLGSTNTISRNIQIATWALQPNPQDSTKTDFAIGGTLANDHIVFSHGASTADVEVSLNGVSQGIYTPTGRLLAFGQAGNDDLQVAGSIELSAWLYGDAGNDRLKGGAGHDVLLGGLGDDLLVGGGGRDLLIGGTGSDRIVGNADDDILIAGYTTFDYDPNGLLRVDHDAAIAAILREWTSSSEYQTRIDNLKNGTGLNGSYKLNADTVGNDSSSDVLTGSAGLDWFLFDSDLDRATDLTDEVFESDLDFILS